MPATAKIKWENSALNEKLQAFDAVKFAALVEVERRLAAFFDAEERFVERLPFQNLKREERAEARLHATNILLEIRYKMLLHVSQQLGSMHARQRHNMQRGGLPVKQGRPVGKALVLQCLAMSENFGPPRLSYKK
jgi:hypothetical protein